MAYTLTERIGGGCVVLFAGLALAAVMSAAGATFAQCTVPIVEMAFLGVLCVTK